MGCSASRTDGGGAGGGVRGKGGVSAEDVGQDREERGTTLDVCCGSANALVARLFSVSTIDHASLSRRRRSVPSLLLLDTPVQHWGAHYVLAKFSHGIFFFPNLICSSGGEGGKARRRGDNAGWVGRGVSEPNVWVIGSSSEAVNTRRALRPSRSAGW